jgi:hypothetical protein
MVSNNINGKSLDQELENWSSKKKNIREIGEMLGAKRDREMSFGGNDIQILLNGSESSKAFILKRNSN